MIYDPNKTPGQCAYESFYGISTCDFLWDQIDERERQRWHAVANAVVRQVKSIIADEVVKAIHKAGNN